MSPELFDPENFGLKNSRPTKRSDCYALGMVIYEVLGRRVPFYRHASFAVVVRVGKGERPRRPQGEERVWFTDDIWSILERCWVPNPGDRPSIEDVLQCLEKSSRSWTLPPSRAITNPTNSSARNSYISTEESADSEVSSLSEAASSQLRQELLQEGDPSGNSPYPDAHELSAFLHNVPDTSAVNLNGPDSAKSGRLSEMVS